MGIFSCNLIHSTQFSLVKYERDSCVFLKEEHKTGTLQLKVWVTCSGFLKK